MYANPTTTASTSTRKEVNMMTKTLTRLAISGAATCLALLATAAPALAGEPGEPTFEPTTISGGPSTDGETGGLDATSVALGGLAGITLAGAGLGVTLGVQRRRDHTPIRPA